MKKEVLRGKHLLDIGYKQGKIIGIVMNTMTRYYKKTTLKDQLDLLKNVLADPERFIEDKFAGKIAGELLFKPAVKQEIALRTQKLEYTTYGVSDIEPGAIHQMEGAMKLPVAMAGALMPDAHQGYGLPIGGVLATDNAVIPFAVGVDIGCRMCLSVFDLPVSLLDHDRYKLKRMLDDCTRFGNNSGFDKPLDDAIFDRREFSELKVAKDLKDKAFKQIGSSGSGNHFVEFGEADITDPANEFGLKPGKYLAVLSHSGSRGLGASIAGHYTKIAMENCLLPGNAKHLAWLDLNTEAGQEYWLAMNLAGDYASACHHQIHQRLSKAIGEKHVMRVENHHNFAWKENLADGREVIVHRKGATPAGKGVLGIIPGSMTAPGFIVRGKGIEASLNSAAHGAGRAMSRTRAKESITPKELKQLLKKHNVDLMGGDIDEAPGAYKDIHKVMKHQENLVEVIGTFTPKIVRMAGRGK